MPIAVLCPRCKSKLKAPDSLVGKVVKCPGCSSAVRINAVAAAPAPPPKAAAPPMPWMQLDDPPAARKPAAPARQQPVIEDLEEVVEEPEEEIADVLPADDTTEDIVEPLDDEDEIAEVEEVPEEEGIQESRSRKAKKKPVRGKQRVPDGDRTTAMLLYLSGLLTGFLGPLIIWLVKRGDSKFIDHHGRKALNFQCSIAIPQMVIALSGFALSCVMGMASVQSRSSAGLMGAGILWMVMLAIVGCLGLYYAIMLIIAAVKAKDGSWYELPGWCRFFG